MLPVYICICMGTCIEICGDFFNGVGMTVTSKILPFYKNSSFFIHARISSLISVSFRQVTDADFLWSFRTSEGKTTSESNQTSIDTNLHACFCIFKVAEATKAC